MNIARSKEKKKGRVVDSKKICYKKVLQKEKLFEH